MSLQKCPKCGKKNTFWSVYRDINFSRFKGGIVIKCNYCKNKVKFWDKNKCNLKTLLNGILWMLPAIILVYLVVTSKINFLLAILLITIFHFSAMYFIIKYSKYDKKK